MSYQEALEAAGASVIAYESFGSYQGDWIARIGDDEYVQGSYGSCTGCDGFQAEFGYSEPACDEHQYEYPVRLDCDACLAASEAYDKRLAAFGARYLDYTQTRAELIAQFAEDIQWDEGAISITHWLQEQN